MTTKDKALAIANTLFRPYRETLGQLSHKELMMTLEHVVEQHEAFKQKVSDAVVDYFGEHLVAEDGGDTLASFIIPKPKPDPLVRVINEVIYAQPHGDIDEIRMADDFRAALEARGLEIREKNDD